MHASEAYRMYDRRIWLHAPPQVRHAWDLLYGAMTDPDRSAVLHDVRIEVTADGLVSVDGIARCPAHGPVMARLQEVVQDEILPAVTSHLLWHGAVWRIDGKALLVVADSGCGKTTLSLRHLTGGGEVWSDEACGWELDAGGWCPWPRAMAVRPDSLALVGVGQNHLPFLDLDERKHVIPVSGRGNVAALSPGGIVLLAWAEDGMCREEHGSHIVEVSVPGRDRSWINTWRATQPGWEVLPHPDGTPWWRIRSREAVTADRVAVALREAGARFGGWHGWPCRRPDFRAVPETRALNGDALAGALLAHTLNGRALAAVIGEACVWQAARRAVDGVPGCLVVPGELAATHRLLVEAVR